MKQQRISGKEAVRVAEDMAKPGPIRVVEPREVQEAPGALVPSAGSELDRKVPPRVRKPLPRNDPGCVKTPRARKLEEWSFSDQSKSIAH